MPYDMTEDEFRESIHKKHQDHFAHVTNLHQFTQESMAQMKVEGVTAYQTTLCLILAKAFKSFDSIRRLCEIAYCEDAGVILRSLLNLLAITRWISADPETRSLKYLGWYWMQLKEDAEKHKDRIPEDLVKQIDAHYQKVRPRFEFKDWKGQVQVARKWHQPEISNIADMCKDVGLEIQYEEAYRVLSSLEHSDATAYISMLKGSEKGDVRNLTVHNDLFVRPYLRNAFQYFGDIFSICNDGLKFADAEKLREIVNNGMKFFSQEVRSVKLEKQN